MKSDAKILDILNQVLKNELTAINQYLLHSRMLKHWGVTKLAKHEFHQSMDEMKDADVLIERILLLEGMPNLQDLGKLLLGESVQEILECDLKLELSARPALIDGIAHSESVRDYESRHLLREILSGEEAHIDYLETQLDLVRRIGIENYTQLQSEAQEK